MISGECCIEDREAEINNFPKGNFRATQDEQPVENDVRNILILELSEMQRIMGCKSDAKNCGI